MIVTVFVLSSNRCSSQATTGRPPWWAVQGKCGTDRRWADAGHVQSHDEVLLYAWAICWCV